MLARRIVPCLDVRDGRVVKGVNFVELRDAGDPVDNARFYQQEEADELVFLDITASAERRSIMIDVVRRVSREVFMPLTVGGGIHGLEDIHDLLRAGADKVSINTTAVKDPSLITAAARRFGRQCIVVAVDAKRVDVPRRPHHNGKTAVPGAAGVTGSTWEVYVYGGREPTGLDVLAWVREAEDRGAGEFLLTSMDRDGTEAGYDLELTRAVARSVAVPVIASGGAGAATHFLDVFQKGEADAALAASIFHYRRYRIREIKEYLQENNVVVRL